MCLTSEPVLLVVLVLLSVQHLKGVKGNLIVCVRLSPPPALAFSLSLHRHPYLYIPLSSRFVRYNKQQHLMPSRLNSMILLV